MRIAENMWYNGGCRIGVFYQLGMRIKVDRAMTRHWQNCKLYLKSLALLSCLKKSGIHEAESDQ
jgi:hypothetical protein